MKNLALTLILSLSSIFGNYSYAQKGIIYLTNPSFEGTVRLNSLPRGWRDCGKELFRKETPPDVHPMVSEIFGVNQKPAHGFAYLGLLIRETGSWESVSQKLLKPLKANQCYAFRIAMCRSENYKSGFQKNKIDKRSARKNKGVRIIIKSLTKIAERGDINFTDPAVLRIWRGDESCDRKQLLAISPLVKNTEWADYFFKIKPDANYKSLTFEVFDGDEIVGFPNGNILLDDASPLIPIDCDWSEEKIKKIDIRKYDLNLNTITSEEKLEWFVRHNSSRLVFNFENKFTRMAKMDFSMILAAMYKFPNKKLVVLLDGSDRWAKQDRVKAVLNQINSLGFPAEQCDVRAIKRKDKKGKWLIRRNGIFIKIIPM